MENIKIGSREAIALLATITFNHIILNITKSILDFTGSSSLLNLLYISLITIIFTSIICYFLNKFPTFDIIDISKYLGGNTLKWIIGIAYVAYFIFFSGILLHIFSSCLQIIYFPLTKIFYIILVFVIASIIALSFKYNAIFRSTFIFFSLLIISLAFLFLSDMPYFDVNRIYPIWGKGLYTTFISGVCNMFAFQALAYIYFTPPLLKEPEKLKKVAINSIVISSMFLLISVSVVLFMFDAYMDTDELMPLYSAAKYIEYSSFFRKLDSLFILIWIISFVSYLSITLKYSSNILRKLFNIENSKPFIYILAIALFFTAIWPKNYSVSTFFADTVYKYAFFVLVIGITFLVLFFAWIKQVIRRRFN